MGAGEVRAKMAGDHKSRRVIGRRAADRLRGLRLPAGRIGIEGRRGNETQESEELRRRAERGRGRQLDHELIRSRLLRIRADLIRELESCSCDLLGESSLITWEDSFDAEPGRWMTARVGEHISAHLRRVESAIGRLDNGQYGLCLDCRRGIAKSRLAADPAAVRCLRCQLYIESQRRGRLRN